MKYYKLTDETITLADGTVLHRIECINPIPELKIRVGDKGGFIEKESNLSGNAWVYENAKVYGDAFVYGEAEIFDKAEVFGNAEVQGKARVHGKARVYGNAWVYDKAEVYDNAEVYGEARVYGYAEVLDNAVVQSFRDYIVFKNWWSSGRFFTWTRSNDMWRVGCFYGTGDELIAKAYNDSEESGREYERVVRYVESILKEEEDRL